MSKVNKWQDWEKDYLRETYPKSSVKICAEFLKRPIKSVSNKAFTMDLKIDFHPFWNKGL